MFFGGPVICEELCKEKTPLMHLQLKQKMKIQRTDFNA